MAQIVIIQKAILSVMLIGTFPHCFTVPEKVTQAPMIHTVQVVRVTL